MPKYEEISLIEFMNRFPDDDACREHLFKLRWPEGFRCPVCGHTEYTKHGSRELYICKSCGHQTSVTAGTIMHGTKVPVRYWFLAAHLIANDKRGISALRLSKELDCHYRTAWTMLHKIRKAMTDRDSKYFLSDTVEVDETYVGAPSENGKRGRGTDKIPVVVSLSLDSKGAPAYVKMRVADKLDRPTISGIIESGISHGAVIRTDALKVYNYLDTSEHYTHESRASSLQVTEKENEYLKWMHVIISNVKHMINGTLHGLDRKHIQRYLDEYCYRFNRRKFRGQIFNRLLVACVSTITITRRQLMGYAMEVCV